MLECNVGHLCNQQRCRDPGEQPCRRHQCLQPSFPAVGATASYTSGSTFTVTDSTPGAFTTITVGGANISGILSWGGVTVLEQGIHPTVIAQGYRLGMQKALEITDSLSFKVDPKDRKTLVKIADTAITGKSIESVKGKLDGIIVDAVMTIAEKVDGKYLADEDDVMIKKQKGKSMDDAELVRGIVLDKKRISEGMPKKVTNAKVALIATPMEITKTQVKAKIKITTADQISAFSEQERATLKKLADAIMNARRECGALPEGHRRPGPVLPCKERHLCR